MEGSTRGRPGLLWLWRDQPSRLGAGSQQRAAHLLLALADYFELHVVVVTVGASITSVQDEDLFSHFASFQQVRTLEPGESPSLGSGRDGRPAELPRADIPARVAALRRSRGVEATLIFSFELAVFLRGVLPQLQPAYLDLDELMSRKQERFVATPGLSQARIDEFRRTERLTRSIEQRMLPQFSGLIVSSELETPHLRGLVPDERVSFVPNATHRQATLPPPPPGSPRTLMFVGRLDYFPNIDAAEYFLAEVWPLLRARYGDAVRFHIVGAGAYPPFQPETVPGVVFDRGRADIVPVYREASLAVAPIRSGGGTRVKIIEAFALGRPVVSTTMGAEGLGVEDGRHLLIADTPEAFAAACADLLDDREKADRLAAAASEWVQAHHSTAVVRAAVAASVIVRALRPRAGLSRPRRRP